jgi:hypothetical protein
MNYTDFIASVEAEWEPDTGFLWKARQGNFDETGFNRTRSKLQALSINENAQLPRRLVTILWYMPLFMSWQSERVRESGGDERLYKKAVVAITNEVERLLGTP